MPDLFNTSSGMKPEEKAEEGGKEEKKDDGGGEVPDEVKNHPAFKAAVEKAAKADEMGVNIKNMGDIISEKDKKLKEYVKAAPVDASKLPFDPAKIKWSKDLTAEEKDDMTANEVAAVDSVAKAQTKANEVAETQLRAAAEAELSKDEPKTVNADERKPLIEAAIRELSGGDAEKTRELNEAVSMLNFQGLTAEQVKERVKAAYKLIPSYVPPKEQASGGGSAVKSGGESSDGAEATADRIIKEVAGVKAGNYEL